MERKRETIPRTVHSGPFLQQPVIPAPGESKASFFCGLDKNIKKRKRKSRNTIEKHSVASVGPKIEVYPISERARSMGSSKPCMCWRQPHPQGTPCDKELVLRVAEKSDDEAYGRATSNRFSISFRTFSSSSLLTKEMESPLVPNRPARPTRCRYESASAGKS